MVSKRINHLVPAKMSEGGSCVTVYCAVCHAGATSDQDSGWVKTISVHTMQCSVLEKEQSDWRVLLYIASLREREREWAGVFLYSVVSIQKTPI